MFDKFSAAGLRVITLAQEEAFRYSTNFVGSEHLLLGLIKTTPDSKRPLPAFAHIDNTVVALTFSNLGVTLEEARKFLMTKRNDLVDVRVPFTESAKSVLVRANSIAAEENSGNPKTETAHLILSLCEENEGPVQKILRQKQICLDVFTNELSRLRAQKPADCEES